MLFVEKQQWQVIKTNDVTKLEAKETNQTLIWFVSLFKPKS